MKIQFDRKNNGMARFLKKLMSLCIICTLLSGYLVTAQTFPEDITGKPFENDAKLLMTLGIMKPNTVENFSPEVTISRSEMAAIVTKLLNLQLDASSKADYADVPENYYTSSDIKAVTTLGIMSGKGDGNFYPEEFITYGDALTICLRVLGYKELAEKTPGEYPYNYYAIARDMGLTKRLNISLTENITRGSLATLLRNTLEMELYQVLSVEGDNVIKTVKKGETLLSQYYKIFLIKGQVMGSDVSFLNSSASLPENKVQIGNLILDAGTTDISDLLGHYVWAYYQQEEEKVIYYEEITNKKPLQIDAGNVISYENSVLYYEQDANEIRFTVPGTLYVIYNKKAVTNYSAEMLTPESGKLTFIDGNNDGSYDVVFIEDYKDYVVDRLNAIEETVLFTDGTRINFAQNGVDVFIKDASGSQIDFASLKQGDVLTCFSSDDKKYMEFYKSDKSVSGTVTSVFNEGKTGYLLIDNGDGAPKKYAVDCNFHKQYPSLTAGDYGVFNIDIYGKIAGYSEQKTDSMLLGYLVGIKVEDDMSEDIKLKIFSEKEEMIIRSLPNKVDLDGKRIEKKDVPAGLKDNTGNLNQLIRFKLNEKGEITFIDTPKRGSEEVTNEAGEKETRYLEGDERLIETCDTKGVAQPYYTAQMVFFGTVFLEMATKVFAIPSGDIDSAQDKDYRVLGPSELENGTNYAFKSYKENAKNIGSSAVVLSTSEKVVYPQYEVLSFISKITKTVNESGDIVDKVYYFKNRNLYEMLAVDDKLFEGRSVGDAMMIKLNIKNEISAYVLYFDAKTQKLTATSNPSHGDYNAGRRTIYGSACYFKGDMFAVVTGDVTAVTDPVDVTTYINEIHKLPKSLYLFDTKKQKVRLATSADIVDYYADKQNYCKIFCFSIYSLDYDAMIVI